jgi:uncharacterized protein YbjT (DUF2867 family)
MTKKILVIGAAGFVGTPIVRQLLADGFAVKALVRNEQKARHLLGDAVELELVVGDLTDRVVLESALAGVDGVNLSAPWKKEADLAKNVSRILAAQGRKDARVTYISGTTTLPENRWAPMIAEKLKAEHALIDSGVEYTILRPSWFMDALPLFVRDGRATLFGKQTQAYYFLSLVDFARAVSDCYKKEETANQTMVLNGPQALQMLDALQQYCDVAAPGIRAAIMPIWFGNMLAWMTKSPELRDVVGMMAYFEKSPKVSSPNGAEGWVVSAGMTMAEWLKTLKDERK